MKMTIIQSQDDINNFFPSEKTKKVKADHVAAVATRKGPRPALSVQKEPILMTCYRAEGRHGYKTAPTQKQEDLPMEDEDQQSSNSARPSAKSRPRRSESPEKVRKHVTWAPEIWNHLGGDRGRPQISVS